MDKKVGIRDDYSVRINKVLNHIQANLESPFKLSELSAIGNFSRHHFHRIISAYLGEPLGGYIKRVRIEKAAQLLRYSDSSITEISELVGYDTLSSLSAAFHKRFGLSPTAYRKKYSTPKSLHMMDRPEKVNFDFCPTIKTIPPMKIAFVRVFGKYGHESIGEAWDRLFKFATGQGLMDEKTKMFGISYDNPEITENEKYEYNACISIEKDIKPEGEVGMKEMKGGKYAVFTYKGSYENFPLIYELIFKEWLLKSEHELRDTEIFDRYINTPFDTGPNDLLTEIHLPLK
ncbi:GyrI-like domain-containing protein [Allomuricauda sp. SCSIO 65647]|uniref:AraC family transcriptional regulator n=1 Tax=Allomuricauda sp. SCSIO 65647 TaxID=2908843 RepID=UPI001F1C61DB|nr:AraC family transcriptional regulator [Muricauda sp. SCSIO 65647]UJH68524.1 AraC family transcriptional regulator [Muricauda sp. SCSIO 65647]